MTTFTPTIPKIALQALSELTGEPQAEIALLIALKDALRYRLAIVEEAIELKEQDRVRRLSEANPVFS